MKISLFKNILFDNSYILYIFKNQFVNKRININYFHLND